MRRYYHMRACIDCASVANDGCCCATSNNNVDANLCACISGV